LQHIRTNLNINQCCLLHSWAIHHYDGPSPLILSVDESDEISIADAVAAIAHAMNFEGELKVK
jgi:hypothetical protein